ncbi:MAG: hypothetical protein UMV23_07080 [Halanaerobium sp.]|nr:hypothetical protein [Halanaerobium sp.]
MLAKVKQLSKITSPEGLRKAVYFLFGLGTGLLIAGLLLLAPGLSSISTGGQDAGQMAQPAPTRFHAEDGLYLTIAREGQRELHLEKGEIMINVEPGMSAFTVARQLESAGLATAEDFLAIMARTGWDRAIKPGTYRFSPDQSELRIILEICNQD